MTTIGLAAILIPSLIGAATSLDPTLSRDLFLLENYRANPSKQNTGHLVNANLPVLPDPDLKFFVYFQELPSTEDLDLMGRMGITLYPQTFLPPVGAHPLGFMSAKGPSSSILKLARLNLFPRLTAAYRKLKPHNDLTAEETRVSEARTWDQPLYGRGVRLAILDSGFRLEHPDLPEPVASMDYSAWPDTNTDVSDRISGHGTHVAGTAFGDGDASDGSYAGMAPEASPIYLKIGDDSTSDATSEAVIGALRGAATWARADIASMSYGGWDGFNDGSSAEEQAVDWAVEHGVAVFMSAGNSANEGIHFSGELQPNSTSDRIRININNAPEEAYWGVALVWYDGVDTSIHIPLTLRILDRDDSEVWIDSLPQVSSPRGSEFIDYLVQEPLPRDTSFFNVRVTNHSGRVQRYHLWTRSAITRLRFNRPDRTTTVLLPSSADSCISVGAYTARTEYTDFEGSLHDDRTTRGEIASFSSIGPRLDGLTKPDICAPGRRTISCRDFEVIQLGSGADYLIVSNDGGEGLPADYIVFMGTSMSSPAAAGTAALILEGQPDLTPATLRSRIFETARTDSSTGNVPNTTWGWGKIDVARALAIEDDAHTDNQPPESLKLLGAYPNPANGEIAIKFEAPAITDLVISLFDQQGRRLYSESFRTLTAGEQRFTLGKDLVNVSGVYFCELSDRASRHTAKLALIR